MVNKFDTETTVIELIIKDSGGTPIDHTLETIHDIEVILLSKLDASEIQKFSRSEKTGWTQAVTTSAHMLLHVSDFSDATKGLVEAQVNIYTPDVNQPSGYSVHTQKGIVLNLNEAWQITE